MLVEVQIDPERDERVHLSAALEQVQEQALYQSHNRVSCLAIYNLYTYMCCGVNRNWIKWTCDLWGGFGLGALLDQPPIDVAHEPPLDFQSDCFLRVAELFEHEARVGDERFVEILDQKQLCPQALLLEPSPKNLFY